MLEGSQRVSDRAGISIPDPAELLLQLTDDVQ